MTPTVAKVAPKMRLVAFPVYLWEDHRTMNIAKQTATVNISSIVCTGRYSKAGMTMDLSVAPSRKEKNPKADAAAPTRGNRISRRHARLGVSPRAHDAGDELEFHR